MTERLFWQQAARVRPTDRQLAFLQQPFYAFVHFGPNTFTGREWGDGTDDPALFNPAALDCDQWVEAIKAAGMTGLILTAKHHDGFCLWQTDTTAHSVRSSPWRGGQGDMVQEAAEACRRGGIRFGFYLSPWDRNCPLYGTPAYNDFYKAQLTELLTRYGDVFCVWFDGACGEGPDGRKQEYDFAGYIDLVRRYQPNACIFHDAGPDMRWVGNESGTAREAEWMVVPHELCRHADPQTHGALVPGGLDGIYNTWPDLGSREIIQHSSGLTFCPAETDMSIRPGWFYHPEEEPHSLARLLHTYVTSVGGSCTFNLNIPPMPDGRFDSRDVKRLRELGDALREAFGTAIGHDGAFRGETPDALCLFRITLPAEAAVRYVTLAEDIAQGQRVERFLIREPGGDQPRVLFAGTTIGSRRICDLGSPQRLASLEVVILAARDSVESLDIRLT